MSISQTSSGQEGKPVKVKEPIDSLFPKSFFSISKTELLGSKHISLCPVADDFVARFVKAFVILPMFATTLSAVSLIVGATVQLVSASKILGINNIIITVSTLIVFIVHPHFGPTSDRLKQYLCHKDNGWIPKICPVITKPHVLSAQAEVGVFSPIYQKRNSQIDNYLLPDSNHIDRNRCRYARKRDFEKPNQLFHILIGYIA